MNKVHDKVHLFVREQPIAILFVLFALLSVAVVPNFSNPINLRNMLVQSTELIVIACGMVFVIMNGGIDFSATSNIAIGSVIGAMIMSTSEGLMMGSPLAPVVGVIAMLSIGLAIGSINAFSVTVLKMPSFIATMVTQLIFGGLALWIPSSRTIPNLPAAFQFLEQGKILGIRTPIYIAAIVVVICYYLLHKTVFGRQLFAIGTNHKTSEISGIPVKKVIFKTFLICGFLSALGGIIMTARIGGGVPDLGRTIFLDILAAAIIGGTSVTGGRGSIFGAAVGAAFIIVLGNALSCLRVEWYMQNVGKGMLVLVAAILDMYKQRQLNL